MMSGKDSTYFRNRFLIHFPQVSLPSVSEFRTVTRDASLNPIQKVKGYGNILVRFIDAFDDIDSNYVERIRYDFTTMMQATSNYEFYNLGSHDLSQRLSFAQNFDLRLGPYFGWKWLFLGYTVDLLNLGSSSHKTGSRFELSIYTSMIGADFFYRETGNDFFIRSIVGLSDEAKKFEGRDCSYISSSMKGINLYYNFNHRRYSSPAVYSQSTVQRKSAGSLQLGCSITAHDVHFDYSALPEQLFTEIQGTNIFQSVERIKYIDYSVSVGYGYNWVFFPDWCLGISVNPALGYKRTSTQTAILVGATDEEQQPQTEEDNGIRGKLNDIFRKRGDLNINGTGRVGLIYNNGRWFTGLFAVLQTFNYRSSGLYFNNTFGTVNLCGGFYFMKNKPKKKKTEE